MMIYDEVITVMSIVLRTQPSQCSICPAVFFHKLPSKYVRAINVSINDSVTVSHRKHDNSNYG